jgi:hypothetical protein
LKLNSEVSPRRYRKRPAIVEAMRYDGTNAHIATFWIGSSLAAAEMAKKGERLAWMSDDGKLCLMTQNAPAFFIVEVGDWIVKGVEGEFYPCRASIFEATHERAPDA